MQKIGTNKEVLDYLQGQYTLLDAVIIEFRIYEQNYVVNIDINFRLTHSKGKVLLTFKDVVEYAFYHNSSHHFYTVEAVPKFFTTDDGKFYLSLDPDEMVERLSEDDNDMILSNGLEGFISIQS